ncbi:MAG: SIMPL domain-containing protein [candidate division SR1 bacterium]|nr:SIMPL domain-containing protein [candidate division SR1 bacterium]
MADLNPNTNEPRYNFLNFSIIVTLFSFLILAMLLGGSVVYFQYLRYKSEAKTSKIEILGIAEEKVKYDKLTMAFVISKSGTDSSELNKQIDELTIKALDMLAKNAIKKENIQTVKNSYPDYSDQYKTNSNSDLGKVKKTIFDVRFTVKIDDLQNNLNLPNTLAKELTAIGVNQFDPYNYEITNQRAICDELKTDAIVDAHEKGVTQIKAIGGNEIVSTQIQAGGDSCTNFIYPIPFLVQDDKMMANPSQGQITTTEVVAGEKNITQQVTVTFEYR